jgi:hypothetical protein
MATSTVRFTRRFKSSHHGQVEVGDQVELSEHDAKRYIKAGWAEPVAAKPVKKAPAKRGRPAGRNGKEG